MRTELLDFAREMQIKLNMNSHKRGWDELTPRQCLYRMKQEMGELERAVESNKSKGDVVAECADVANFAMFLAHNYEPKEHK